MILQSAARQLQKTLAQQQALRRTLMNSPIMPKNLPHNLPDYFLKNPKMPSWKVLAGAAFLGVSIGQHYFGDEKDFYDYRFITEKDPDDLAGFYGSEAFMDLFCVLPLMGTLMMRGGYFDEEGTVHTTGLPGEMLVSMVFSDEADEDGTTKWFNKRERFRDICFGYTCWDMVTNFGFEKLPDGRTVVYHHGEYFKGSLPPISLLVRLVFGIHARWVAWATEHHINHYAFQNDTEFDEHLELESREDMPLFLLKNYAWSDLMGAVFGKKISKPSFLIKKSEEAALLEADDDDEDEEEEEIEEEDAEEEEELPVKEEFPLPTEELPTQRPVIMRRITNDIKIDRRNSKIVLKDLTDETTADDAETGLLAKRSTVQNRIRMDVALDRHQTMRRQMTKVNEKTGKEEIIMEPRENKGGNAAWEALRSTNNPQAYKAATIAAGERYMQRRATMAAMEEAKSLEKNAAAATTPAQENALTKRAMNTVELAAKELEEEEDEVASEKVVETPPETTTRRMTIFPTKGTKRATTSDSEDAQRMK